MKDIVILGAGETAREVLDVFEACNKAGQKYDVLGYIIEPQRDFSETVVNDKPVLGDISWLVERRDEVYAICAVGDPGLRLRIVRQAQKLGVCFCSIVHPSAVLTRWVTMGEGVVITAGCILTNRVHIGNHVYLNLGCTVGHDAVLDDFVTLSPGVHVSGRVTLATGAYVGTGASIIAGIHVGEWSIIGVGSAIIKNVPPNTTVFGVPGKIITTRERGWHLSKHDLGGNVPSV